MSERIERIESERARVGHVYVLTPKGQDDIAFLLGEVKKLAAQIADLHKWRSQRRQMIRDGWNVEFDRESGHELWVRDDPPLADDGSGG